MSTPTPYIKLFDVGTPEKPAHEAEVWIDVPGHDNPVSLHTTPTAQRETTAERRAQRWVNSDAGVEALHLELFLLGAE